MDHETNQSALNQVVVRAQQGDQEAIAELVARFSDMARGQALGTLGDRTLAEDAAQEAMARAVDSLAELQAPEAFVNGLRVIVFRQCDRVTRRRTLRIVSLSDLIEPTGTELLPDDLVIRAEQALAVRKAVDQLPQAQRDAIAAYYLENRSQAETADLLATSVSTVNNRLHAARNNLRRKLTSMNPTSDNAPVAAATVPSSETEAARIYDALDTTGPAGPRWRAGRLARSRFDWDTSRVATDDTDVLALVGVYDLSMRIDHSTVRTAGFNLDYHSDRAAEGAIGELTTKQLKRPDRLGTDSACRSD